MGLIDDLLMRGKEEGVCESCGNLVAISEKALGCRGNDKLILPDYVPHTKYVHKKCNLWIAKNMEA